MSAGKQFLAAVSQARQYILTNGGVCRCSGDGKPVRDHAFGFALVS